MGGGYNRVWVMAYHPPSSVVRTYTTPQTMMSTFEPKKAIIGDGHFRPKVNGGGRSGGVVQQCLDCLGRKDGRFGALEWSKNPLAKSDLRHFGMVKETMGVVVVAESCKAREATKLRGGSSDDRFDTPMAWVRPRLFLALCLFHGGS